MLFSLLTSVNRFLYWTLSPGASCSQAFIKASTDSSSFSGKNDRKHCSKSARVSVPWKNTAFISLNFLSTIPYLTRESFSFHVRGILLSSCTQNVWKGYEESWCWTQYNIIQNSWVRFPTKVKRIIFPLCGPQFRVTSEIKMPKLRRSKQASQLYPLHACFTSGIVTNRNAKH